MSGPRPPRLIFLLSSAERAVRRWIDARGNADGVTAAKGGALMFLRQNPAATMSELASALRASPAGASGLLARMESGGLVSRVPDQSDQRITRVTLTARGTDVAHQTREAIDELNSQLTDGFDEQELATVARWLNHVAGTLAAADTAAHAEQPARESG